MNEIYLYLNILMNEIYIYLNKIIIYFWKIFIK